MMILSQLIASLNNIQRHHRWYLLRRSRSSPSAGKCSCSFMPLGRRGCTTSLCMATPINHLTKFSTHDGRNKQKKVSPVTKYFTLDRTLLWGTGSMSIESCVASYKHLSVYSNLDLHSTLATSKDLSKCFQMWCHFILQKHCYYVQS